MIHCPYCTHEMREAPKDSSSLGYCYCEECRRWVSPREYRRNHNTTEER